MLGLFGTLNLGTRALQTQQTGLEVTGQNLANVNNPAYARQRVLIQTSPTVMTFLGPQGTGADPIAIQQIRSAILDAQVVNEASVGGYWTAQQSVLQNAQAELGQYLDISSDVNGTGIGTPGLASQLNAFFNALQSVATSPESLPERQNLISQAQSLADTFNQVSSRLASLSSGLDASLNADVASANQLLADIADLNDRIANAEVLGGGKANDLRDLRLQKLEALAQFTNFDTSAAPDGSVVIAIDGVSLVSGKQVLDTLQVTPTGIATFNSGTPLNLAGGSLKGTLDARDVALQKLRDDLDTLAGTLASRVNAIHATGYNLAGGNGTLFFDGTNAGDIAVNAALLADPSLFQASGVAGATGDNTVALQLAQLFQNPDPALGSPVTYMDFYTATVAGLGGALENANDQLAGHQAVNTLLLAQRESISGVSIDEEMTNLITFQRAYQASAKIITTVDEMLETVINLKR